MLTSIEENPNEKNSIILERCQKLLEYNLEIMKTIEEVSITHKKYCNL